MQFVAVSDRGRVRANNEDVVLVPNLIKNESIGELISQSGYLFIVCDGVGGHNAGEIASATASKLLMDDWYGNRHRDLRDSERLQIFLSEANTEIRHLTEQNPDYLGMATTITVLLIKEGICTIANIGDSRTYRYQDKTLDQITKDHSQIWPLYEGGFIKKDDLRTHPKKNYITRALGFNDEVQIDIFEVPLPQNGFFLLCTDGLTDMLSDDQIGRILQKESALQSKADLLLQTALDEGGKDNVSFVLVQI